MINTATLKERIRSLEPLFNPGSIAVVGASNDFVKPGGQPLIRLSQGGFKGKIYPVNPNYQELEGLPCYPSLSSIPGEVELAIITIPASRIMEVLKECVAKGVKAAIIFTSGFAEAGEEGIKLQEEIRDLTSKNNFRVCGPNCVGIINAENSMKAFFTYTELVNGFLDEENIFGFISQSGGYGHCLYNAVVTQRIGVSKYISSGNEADVDFAEFLAYLACDSKTEIIGGYIEGIKDGKKLAAAADLALEARKPVLVLKSGCTPASARAALSHTGSLAGSELVCDSFFRQKGIIRLENTEEIITTLLILENGKLPQGKGVAILTSSGGHGVIMADKCTGAGLEVVTLTEETQTRMAQLLPVFASTTNPVDLAGQDMIRKNILQKCAQIALDDPGVHMLMIFHLASKVFENSMREQVVNICHNTEKPVITLIEGLEEYIVKNIEYLRKHHVPVAWNPEFAARAMNAVADYALKIKTIEINKAKKPVTISFTPQKQKAAGILAKFGPRGRLSEAQSKEILSAYGIPVTRERQAFTVEEAVEVAGQIGYPVVIKINSPDIPHKSEAGGIRINLTFAGEVRHAFEEVMSNARRYNLQANLQGVLVQEMLSGGIEVIVGIKQDPSFGSTVMFGLGGIFVEVLQDIALRVVPFDEFEAWEMIREIKGYRVLEGARGKPPADQEAIVDVILKVAQLAKDFPQIVELDINPLMVFEKGQGACAVDALIGLM